jgi:hypothetical protein
VGRELLTSIDIALSAKTMNLPCRQSFRQSSQLLLLLLQIRTRRYRDCCLAAATTAASQSSCPYAQIVPPRKHHGRQHMRSCVSHNASFHAKPPGFPCLALPSCSLKSLHLFVLNIFLAAGASPGAPLSTMYLTFSILSAHHPAKADARLVRWHS